MFRTLVSLVLAVSLSGPVRAGGQPHRVPDTLAQRLQACTVWHGAEGHPQPYGMPPFRTLLTDTEVAAVTSYIRQSWGNRGAAVSAMDVQRVR